MEKPQSKKGRWPLTSRDRWLTQTLNNIIHRCINPKDKRFKDYGGRGIQNFLTLEDLQMLYERDRPDLMVFPSIDRKEVEGHYQFDNCQFLELVDNIKKAKRRKYPCENCGVVGFPKYFEKRKFCDDCTKAARFALVKFPAYVQFVIRECKALGFLVLGDTKFRGYIARTWLTINGYNVKCHYASIAFKPNANSRQQYWHFTVQPNADVHVLIVKYRKNQFCYVVRGHPLSSHLYIPVKKALQKDHPSLYDWPSLKNAWHLLAPQDEQKKASNQ